jgi:hypothetical protein
MIAESKQGVFAFVLRVPIRSIVKAGVQTPQVSFHPSRDPEIQTEANAIAVDPETAKRDQKMLKKYVRLSLLPQTPVTYGLVSSP